jgi:hypothetical protein
MKSTFSTIKIITLALILSIGLSQVFAWTGPTQAPPNGNTSAPLNVSSSAQTKTGNLWLDGLDASSAPYINGLIVNNGRTGLGMSFQSSDAAAKLALKLGVSGNVGATKYCDASGNNCATPGVGWGYASSTSGSVTKILAGTNITVSPSTGVGNVTVSASSTPDWLLYMKQQKGLTNWPNGINCFQAIGYLVRTYDNTITYSAGGDISCSYNKSNGAVVSGYNGGGWATPNITQLKLDGKLFQYSNTVTY